MRPPESLPPGVLPPGHNCRVDDLAYPDVHAWYRDHRGHVPVQAAGALDARIRATGCTFAEAFEALLSPRGPIVLIGPGVQARRRQR